jgi:hypothetical protein
MNKSQVMLGNKNSQKKNLETKINRRQYNVIILAAV